MEKQRPLCMTTAKPENPATGNPGVPLSRWGSDHWSTFAYLECRVVDNKGVIDIDRMRCDPKRHPGLTNRSNRTFPKSVYPTILKDGFKLADHDDWDCFEDLIAMGLCTWEGTGINPIVKLTAKGGLMAAALRQHKAEGKQFRQFEWPASIPTDVTK